MQTSHEWGGVADFVWVACENRGYTRIVSGELRAEKYSYEDWVASTNAHPGRIVAHLRAIGTDLSQKREWSAVLGGQSPGPTGSPMRTRVTRLPSTGPGHPAIPLKISDEVGSSLLHTSCPCTIPQPVTLVN